jgi:2-polyprenyl-6-methoxyphenol hydroxylase-like FAD-dependent oxidoreductase
LLGNLAYGIERVVDTVQYGLTMAHWNDHDEIFSAPPRIESIAGPRFTFPLTSRHATSYTAHNNRVALVGDAAHTVHPMAGQGLNLGLDDVGALVECIERSYKAGMDITTFLEDYNKTQHMKNTIRQNGIHALHEVFGNHSTVMQHGKSLGMHAVNHVGPLRRQLAAAAAGAV